MNRPKNGDHVNVDLRIRQGFSCMIVEKKYLFRPNNSKREILLQSNKASHPPCLLNISGHVPKGQGGGGHCLLRRLNFCSGGKIL